MGLIQVNGGYEWNLPSGRTAGWHDDSARLGEEGNLVMSGHHNIDGLVFQNLNLLPGDVTKVCSRTPDGHANGIKQGIMIKVKGKQHEATYELSDCKLLLQRNQPMAVLLEDGKLLLQDGEDKLTLVTCWPFTDNSYRLVLIAKQVESKIL